MYSATQATHAPCRESKGGGDSSELASSSPCHRFGTEVIHKITCYCALFHALPPMLLVRSRRASLVAASQLFDRRCNTCCALVAESSVAIATRAPAWDNRQAPGPGVRRMFQVPNAHETLGTLWVTSGAKGWLQNGKATARRAARAARAARMASLVTTAFCIFRRLVPYSVPVSDFGDSNLTPLRARVRSQPHHQWRRASLRKAACRRQPRRLCRRTN